MTRFLRLFAPFRALEADLSHERELAKLTAEQLKAADVARDKAIRDAFRLEHDLNVLRSRMEASDRERDFWHSKSEHWEAAFQAANADAIKARETVADFISQLRFGRRIFEHAPALPEKKPADQPIQKQRVQARVMVQQAEAQFQKDLADYARAKQSK
jgi:hypothetical protein